MLIVVAILGLFILMPLGGELGKRKMAGKEIAAGSAELGYAAAEVDVVKIGKESTE